METKFQTSFIPKKPIAEGIRERPSVGLFLLVSIIILLISLAVFAWVYFEKQVLIKNIATDKTVIEKNKASFETDTIESVVRLDSRIKVANELLANHISVSPIFGFIESRTLKSIRFKNFDFSVKGNDDSGNPVMKITMSGQAKDFKTLALQADEFGKVDYRNIIKEPVISNLNLASDGSVNFDFSVSVVSDFLKYINNGTFN